jgi:hypothetical protein
MECTKVFDGALCCICGKDAHCHVYYDDWNHYCLEHFYKSDPYNQLKIIK